MWTHVEMGPWPSSSQRQWLTFFYINSREVISYVALPVPITSHWFALIRTVVTTITWSLICYYHRKCFVVIWTKKDRIYIMLPHNQQGKQTNDNFSWATEYALDNNIWLDAYKTNNSASFGRLKPFPFLTYTRSMILLASRQPSTLAHMPVHAHEVAT